jgi:fucose permease
MRPSLDRFRIGVSFYGVAFMGIGAAAGGVLLTAQIADFGITKTSYGFTFLVFSTGYMLSAVSNGWLIHRLGLRGHLELGAVLSLAASTALALKPGFGLFLALSAVFGFGLGSLDAGLNSYLSTLPRSTALLNYFHAFFGVGALAGPVIAAAILDHDLTWNIFYVLNAALAVPLVLGLARYPTGDGRAESHPSGRRLSTALRLRIVWIAAIFLGVYVGLEVGIGNWGFSFLTEERSQEVLVAGWVISAYWAGLTVGRFVLNAMAERVGVGVIGLVATCIGGSALSALLIWVVPVQAVSTVGLVTIGFFLGPLFPTMVAVVPAIVPEHLVATTIGILVAMSVLGGALFPWLIGASAQRIGMWVLLPFAVGLSALLGWLWWVVSRRYRVPAAVEVAPA